MNRMLCTVALATLIAAPTWAQDKQVDIPVTKVVLFSSGVGYFQHSGEVEGNARMKLSFKTEQINDVLKSMVVADAGGGTVTGVNYASRDPIMRALQSFAVDLSDDPSMANILKQLRGAPVRVMVPDLLAGKVIGVEVRKRRVVDDGTTTILEEPVLNLLTDKGIKALPLDTIQSITIADERLAEELNKALGLLAAANDTGRKPVEIQFRGKGDRDVSVGYISETPVWKVSYRLILGDKSRMQGWAIVENTSDSDWSKVSLSLVSGRPISFIQDLYTPLYLPRPVIQPQLYAALRPKRYEGGYDQKKRELARTPGAPGAPRPKRGRADRRFAGATAADAPAEMAEELLADTTKAMASGGKVGELFHYAISEPVDLQRRRSAMLPILNDTLQTEKVSIYNQSTQATHPLHGVWLTNTTGKKMLGGPITVYEDGSYAGDALIDNLVEGDKRLISYALDLSMLVDVNATGSAEIISGKIVRGVLYIQRRRDYVRTYTLTNKADADRTVVVEHPRNRAAKLQEPQDPAETTDNLYRFKVKVAKGQTDKLKVLETQPITETIAIRSYGTDSLGYYARTREIPQPVRDALAKAITLKQELSKIQADLRDTINRKSAIESGQERLRRNIGSVGQDSDLGRRYLKKLSEQEDQIEQLELEIKDLRKKVDAKENELAKYLNDLNVD